MVRLLCGRLAQPRRLRRPAHDRTRAVRTVTGAGVWERPRTPKRRELARKARRVYAMAMERRLAGILVGCCLIALACGARTGLDEPDGSTPDATRTVPATTPPGCPTGPRGRHGAGCVDRRAARRLDRRTPDVWTDTRPTYRQTPGPTYRQTSGPTRDPTYRQTPGPTYRQTSGPRTHARTDHPTVGPTGGPTDGPTAARTFRPTAATWVRTAAVIRSPA